MKKLQNKQAKRYIAWGGAAVLVLLLAVMPLLATSEAAAEGPQASILKDTVQLRDLDRLLIGGGTLASDTTVELTVPAEVKLEKYLVGNGDVVSQGDPIALVDKVSVMSAVVGVQETLDYLAKQIESASKTTVSDAVNAAVRGTVKHIYAREGDDVRAVMLEHGALAVVSLDDLMAVKIPRPTKLEEGETVCVTLEDDTEVTGTVASNVNGELVVTVEDEDYAPGTTVKVTTEDGNRIGSGELYIYSPWNAHGYSGKVYAVYAEEGQTVHAGQSLMKLAETGLTAQYHQMVSQRAEYEQMLQELLQMHASGVLEAPCDGIVSGVDDEGDYMLRSADAEGKTQLAAIITASGSNDMTEGNPGGVENGGNGEGTGGEGSNPGGEGSGGEGGGEEPPQPSLNTYLCYAARVISVADGMVTVEQDGGTPFSDFSQIPAIPDPLVPVSTVQYPAQIMGQVAEGTMVRILKDNLGTVIQVIVSGTAGPGGMAQGGMPSGGMPGGMGGGMGGGGNTAAFELYSLETVTVATVTSQETMTLDITVDEGDVLLLREGQTGQLLVSPLGGQLFEATITRIANDGMNEGGRTKFTVTASVPKHADMYPGMTGALMVTVDTAKDIPSVPLAALVEQGTKTCVYTGYDEETETLTGLTEVTTGISDGEFVEITGLEVGDTLWYAYYDTLEISLTPAAPGGLFG